jgi:type IV pilus assembly protein PilE
MRFPDSATPPNRRTGGFTLIEIMIVLAILGLLVALALPSYNSYLAKGFRAEARGQLMQTAQFMQRFYAANDSFSTDRAGNAVLSQIPLPLQHSPAVGVALYDLSIPTDSLDPMKFTLQMAPVAGGKMASDPCGTFTLTSTGIKGVMSGTTPGTTTLRDLCWQ